MYLNKMKYDILSFSPRDAMFHYLTNNIILELIAVAKSS